MSKAKSPAFVPPASKWEFRSLGQRVAECRLICKQQGLGRKQTTIMVNMVKRIYADLLKVEKRRVETRQAMLAGMSKVDEKYAGWAMAKEQAAKGPRK